jgi:oxygen-independent coproporphyrinogen-3 oxidase
MYNTVYKYLAKKGFKRYEVSNFALPDYESLHNTVYWTLGEYIGFGVAAHSYINGERFANTESLDEYIEKIDSKKYAVVAKEKLTIEQQKEETIMLSLRTSKGINIETFNRKFHCNILEDKKSEITFLMNNRFIVIERGFLRLAENAFYVLNSVVQKLI